MPDNDTVLQSLSDLSERGQVRRLALAFARFLHSLGVRDAAVLLAAAMLTEIEARGHICLDLAALARDPAALLEWPSEEWEALRAALDLPSNQADWHAALAASDHIYQPDSAVADAQQVLVLQAQRLYLRRYWHDETLIATAVCARAADTIERDETVLTALLDDLFAPALASADSATVPAPDWQKIATAIALRARFSIITGGPGTGKTYTVARLLAALLLLAPAGTQPSIALAAPTGKAAARLRQSIDQAFSELATRSTALSEFIAHLGPARTLHSLLGARPDTRSFRHHAGNPLDLDVLIVDEASMVHVEMMAALLAALPRKTMLILLGDQDQLASVEAGAVLGDLCGDAVSGGYHASTVDYLERCTQQLVPAELRGDGTALAQQTVMLRHSRRFAGAIGELARAVNAGAAASAAAVLRRGHDASLAWLDASTPAALLRLAGQGRAGAEGGYQAYLSLLAQMPRAAASADYLAWVKQVLDAFEGFRILCAVREGEWGVTGLNLAIEQSLHAQGHIQREGEWYRGRPVMVTRNDYSAGVFNGDIGLALPDPDPQKSLRVYFLDGQQLRSILASRLRYVETAYAMTVHKSQGSEFAHTVLVLPPDMSPVITRELIYTGITRTRQRLCIWAAAPALLIAAATIITPS